MTSTNDLKNQTTTVDPMDEDENDESATQWLENLNFITAGRQLVEHMSHVRSAIIHLESAHQCPIDDCCSMLRGFVSAWAASPTAAGLTDPPPKYIALVNLSGQRLVLTTNRTYLFKMLAHGVPDGNPRSPTNGRAMLCIRTMFEARQKHQSLVMVYSMPFQMGMHRVHWDVRTAERRPDGVVLDAQLWTSLLEVKRGQAPRRGVQTSAYESAQQSHVVESLARELRGNDRRAQMLDVDPGTTGDAPMVDMQSTSTREQTLREVCDRLKVDRQAMMSQHAAEVSKIHKKNNDMNAEVYKRERELELELRAEADLAKREAERNRAVAMREGLASQEAKAELSRVQLEIEQERETMRAKVACMQTTTRATARRTSEERKLAEEAAVSKLEEQRRSYTQTIEGIEKRLANARLAEKQARIEGEDVLQRLQRLSEIINGHDEVRERMLATVEWQQKGLRAHKALLSIACKKHRTLRQTHARTRRDLETEIELRLVYEAKLDDAVAKLETVAGRDGRETPVYKDQETSTLPISSKIDFEFGELSTQHAKLQDEMAQKCRRVEELQMQLEQTMNTPHVVAPADVGGYDDFDSIVSTMYGHLANIVETAKEVANARALDQSYPVALENSYTSMAPEQFAPNMYYPSAPQTQIFVPQKTFAFVPNMRGAARFGPRFTY